MAQLHLNTVDGTVTLVGEQLHQDAVNGTITFAQRRHDRDRIH